MFIEQGLHFANFRSAGRRRRGAAVFPFEALVRGAREVLGRADGHGDGVEVTPQLVNSEVEIARLRASRIQLKETIKELKLLRIL